MTADTLTKEKKPRPGYTPVFLTGVVSALALLWFVTQNGIAAQDIEAFTAVFLILGGALPVLAALWIGALGYGYALKLLLLRNRMTGTLIEELALGITGLLIVNWLVASIGLLSPNGAISVFGAGCLLNLLKFLPGKESIRREGAGLEIPWAAMLLVPGLVLLIVAACCPPGAIWRVEAFGYDVTSYHLQLPREWMAAGAMVGLEHNVYSFLPSLIEGGYLLIGVLSGTVVDGVYTCQLFHMTLALLGAASIGKLVATHAGSATGIGAVALFLALPWVTITGSMAYNEMGVLAFGAAALLIAFGESGTTRGGAFAIGLLVGAATLSKLTAGVMVAVPIGLILLLGLNQAVDTEATARRLKHLQLAAVAALAGVLMLSPYLARNYAATGNPVFPFEAEQFGAGHWDETLVARWDTAHGLSPKEEGRLDALGRQWLFNTGYGAVGGQPTPRETENMARFDREGGVPALWIVVVVGGVLLFKHRGTRRVVCAMGLMLGVQVLFWMLATHMQSRFLLPTVLPACVIVGLGYARFAELTKEKSPSVGPLIGSTVVVALGLINYTTMAGQTRTVTDPQTQQQLAVPMYVSIDAPIVTSPVDPNAHPINRLPADSKTLLVADNSGLLYLNRPIVYATAFDEAPLGRAIREAGGDADAVTAELRANGVTHVWVHWAELSRLHETYGHDAEVTIERLEQLIESGWVPLESVGRNATLFALPAR